MSGSLTAMKQQMCFVLLLCNFDSFGKSSFHDKIITSAQRVGCACRCIHVCVCVCVCVCARICLFVHAGVCENIHSTFQACACIEVWFVHALIRITVIFMLITVIFSVLQYYYCHIYIALLSTVKQTHCVHVTCDSE